MTEVISDELDANGNLKNNFFSKKSSSGDFRARIWSRPKM
jgi:hypothetical protein